MRNLLPLPHDIISDILSRLPAKSLLEFQYVCKYWYALISDPSFVKLHLSRALTQTDDNLTSLISKFNRIYSIHLDDVGDASSIKAIEMNYPCGFPYSWIKIVGSSNGLICIIDSGEVVYLWNPCTCEYKKLPIEPIDLPRDESNFSSLPDITYEFGYDSTVDDYKVIRTVSWPHCDVNEVKIYELRTKSWRRIGDPPSNICRRQRHSLSVLVNETLHWRFYDLDTTTFIYSFDIKNEEYREVPQPDNYGDEVSEIEIGELGGCLCIFCHILADFRQDVWVMKHYGAKDSWTKLFSIALSRLTSPLEYFRPLCFTKNGDILAVKDSSEFVLFDLKCVSSRNLEIHGILEYRNFRIDAQMYVESLVSLKSGTYVVPWNKK